MVRDLSETPSVMKKELIHKMLWMTIKAKTYLKNYTVKSLHYIIYDIYMIVIAYEMFPFTSLH